MYNGVTLFNLTAILFLELRIACVISKAIKTRIITRVLFHISGKYCRMYYY